jgi:tetratricopeptide (TPR) repeat protein
MDEPSPRNPLLEAAALGLVIFAVYASGACPSIYVGDSGELVAAVHTLGIPHPSGYPLYVLLGKLWTVLLPFGSIALRMSLFSAACAAAACGLLYGLCRRVGLGRAAAVLSASLLAFAPSLWGEANVQRVYALNTLFIVMATGATLRWQRTGALRDLGLAFFLCGVGATNHTFMGIYAVALAIFVVLQRPALLASPRRLFAYGTTAAATAIAGLLPYAYLPIRSRMQPQLDWGNPESWQGFVAVVLRSDFWERAWIESPADVIPILTDYARSLTVELTWAGAALAIVALFTARSRRCVPVLLPLLVMAGNLAALALHGSRSDIFIWHRYYIPSYAMAALLAGAGWDGLVKRWDRFPGLAWAALLLPAYLLVSGWSEFDRSRYRIAEDFAEAVLESIPPGAHLIATDDNVLFVLIYLQMVEGRRPDVDLILQGVGNAELPPLRFDPDEDPLFFTHHPNWDLPELRIVPVGVVYRAWRPGRSEPAVSLPRESLEGELDPRVPKDYLTDNLIGHFHYTVGFSFEQRDWLKARTQFRAAAAASPENDVLFYNLGLVFARNGLYEDALAAYQRSHAINPRHLASLSKPRATDKIAQLEQERARVVRLESTCSIDPAVALGAARHLALAGCLERQAEPVAGRGHRLRALEIEAAAASRP